MVVVRRQNTVDKVENYEVLKPTKTENVKDPARSMQLQQLVKVLSKLARQCFKCFWYLIKCLACTFVVFCIITMLFPALLVYNVLRLVEKKWSYHVHGWIAMSGQDSLWLQDNKDNRMIINSAIVVKCDNIPQLVSGLQTILQRCLLKVDKKGHKTYSRLKNYIHCGVFQYFLRECDTFDLKHHVYQYQGATPNSHEEMQSLFSTMSGEEISFEHPPWHFVVIPKTYEESNEAIIFFRCHHGVADGISLTRFLLAEFPDETILEKKLVKFSSVHRNLMLLNGLLCGAKILLEKLLYPQDNSIIHGKCPIGQKKMAWSQPISLQQVKNIKNYTGTTVNDVLMSCVSMSFHDYFKAHGISHPPDVTVSVPVDVRSGDQPFALENNFAIVSLSLPVSKEDALESLDETKRQMDLIKHSGEAFVLSVGGNLTMEYFPEVITNLWTKPIANKHSSVLSNVPGPQHEFSIAGNKVTQMFFTPPQRDLVGIGVGLYSYAGQFSIAVQSDKNCLDDPKFIVKAFELRLAELHKTVLSMNKQTEFDRGTK